MSDEELAARFWAPTDPLYDWARRWGTCAAMVETSMWNEIAMAAQFKRQVQHRMMGALHPPAMIPGEEVPADLVAAYKVLAREHGYELLDCRWNEEIPYACGPWFVARLEPAIWPPPKSPYGEVPQQVHQLALF